MTDDLYIDPQQGPITIIREDKRYIKIEDVKVTRERFRPAEKLEGLSASLKTFGQLQPIVIDGFGELSAGFRRLNAAMAAGWTEIWCMIKDEMRGDDLLARAVEIEENVQREEMTWQQKVKAYAELDRLKKILDPKWSQTQTAVVFGVERSRINEAVRVDKMMALFPELAKAKNMTQANSWALQKISQVSRIKEVKDAPEVFSEIEERIVLGDSVETIKSIPAGQFKLILTDPPFGINYDSRKAGTEQSATAYQDDEESYRRLLSMASDLYRVLKPDGWLIWFLGPTWYERCKITFREVGFTVDEMPVIWNRSSGRCYTIRPDRYFPRGYDMALHCIKGDPQMTPYGRGKGSNVLTFDPVDNNERELLVERPVDMYQELIKRLTFEGEVVADFFVGSGSVPAAAASLKREYFGCERDPARRAVALNKIRAYTTD